MFVSNLTNGCKKAIFELSLVQVQQVLYALTARSRWLQEAVKEPTRMFKVQQQADFDAVEAVHAVLQAALLEEQVPFLKVTKDEVLELHMACLGRIRVINDLINATRDPESRDGLRQRLQRVEALRDRLELL